MARQDNLRIGSPVSVSSSGSDYFYGGDRWSSDFRGSVEAIGYDWIVIRAEDGYSRIAPAKDGDFSHLGITLRKSIED